MTKISIPCTGTGAAAETQRKAVLSQLCIMFSTVIAGYGEGVVRLTDAAMKAALDQAVVSPGFGFIISFVARQRMTREAPS